MRRFNLVSSSAVMVALCTLLVGGCGGQSQTGDEQAPNDPQSGGLGSAPGEEQPAPGEQPRADHRAEHRAAGEADVVVAAQQARPRRQHRHQVV